DECVGPACSDRLAALVTANDRTRNAIYASNGRARPATPRSAGGEAQRDPRAQGPSAVPYSCRRHARNRSPRRPSPEQRSAGLEAALVRFSVPALVRGRLYRCKIGYLMRSLVSAKWERPTSRRLGG